MKRFSALGIMSGSSLDGIDLAMCDFWIENSHWQFKIVQATTYPYPEEWRLKLFSLPSKSHQVIKEADIEFGMYIGNIVNRFLNHYKLKPDLIASHGHTIFHEPEKGYTLQIGDGQSIAKNAGITTINDFRSKDIELGGQGAPLVPIGDELLFKEYDFCLNIGGIANISYNDKNQRIAFDVCPANQLLNYLSMQLGAPYDKNGTFARLGKLNSKLFNLLNTDAYYVKSIPKSLSNQYVQEEFIPKLDTLNASIEDKLYTVAKHIAFQIDRSIRPFKGKKILVTGGGAHNNFLADAISMETNKELLIPVNEIVDFKEALIFAFMGILKSIGKVNCLSSATGALRNSSCGVIHHP